MLAVYRGIDIAGEGSSGTGAVDLVRTGRTLRVRVLEGGFSGPDSLDRLATTSHGERLVAGAIDQPFGFPWRTLRLLEGQHINLNGKGAGVCRFRRADLAMRERLKEANKGSSDSKLILDWVLPPVRCENIWRALVLLEKLGRSIPQSRLGETDWVETHPRLVAFQLVEPTPQHYALVKSYKYESKKGSEEGRRDARAKLLDLAHKQLPELEVGEKEKSFLVADHNQFEAFFCAVSALAHRNQAVIRYPEEELAADELDEGYVFVPDWRKLGSDTGDQTDRSPGMPSQFRPDPQLSR